MEQAVVRASLMRKVFPIWRPITYLLIPFMIPEFFVEMSSLPVTPNGKTDVKKLPIVRK